jgi:tellurite methyltransferase
MTPSALNQELGNCDLYLLDAILKGYFPAGSSVLDAGCGEGRNLHWFLKEGYPVWGIDSNPAAIRMLRFVAASLQKGYSLERFTSGTLEAMPYADGQFDAVICSAVLHFAEHEEQFRQMWAELWRVLRPGGILFIRTATDAGLQPHELQAAGEGRYLLPDGSYRFLLTQPLLDELLGRYPLQWREPYKSVLVQSQRSMGVLLLQKTITAPAE